MSALKRYLVGFIFSMIGLFGGLAIIFLTTLIGSLFIVNGPADSIPVIVGILVAQVVSFIVYLLLVFFPMLYMAWKKGSQCKNFHSIVFGILPLALLFLRDAIIPPVRLSILFILASLAVYHFAIIYSRYYRGKKRAAELIVRR